MCTREQRFVTLMGDRERKREKEKTEIKARSGRRHTVRVYHAADNWFLGNIILFVLPRGTELQRE